VYVYGLSGIKWANGCVWGRGDVCVCVYVCVCVCVYVCVRVCLYRGVADMYVRAVYVCVSV